MTERKVVVVLLFLVAIVLGQESRSSPSFPSLSRESLPTLPSESKNVQTRESLPTLPTFSTTGRRETGGGSLNRTLTVDFAGPRGVRLASLRRDGLNFEQILFFVGLADFGGQLSVGLLYTALNASTRSFQQWTYFVEFDSITYTNDNGTETGKIDFQNLRWKSFVLTPLGTNFDVVAESSNGEIKVTSHVVAEVGNVGDVPVKPTSLKFDVDFSKTSTDNLNLNTKVFSTNQLVTSNESDEEREGFTRNRERQISFGSAVGFFSWATVATINGENVTVDNTDLTPPVFTNATRGDGGEAHGLRGGLTFTFKTQGTGLLNWDPKVGAPDAIVGLETDAATAATSEENSSSIKLFSFLLVLVAFLLL